MSLMVRYVAGNEWNIVPSSYVRVNEIMIDS